jgi:hypothetical protein
MRKITDEAWRQKEAEQLERRLGRPPKTGAPLREPIAVRFPISMRTAIEKICAGRMDEPDLSAVIRELVAEALTARSEKK